MLPAASSISPGDASPNDQGDHGASILLLPNLPHLHPHVARQAMEHTGAGLRHGENGDFIKVTATLPPEVYLCCPTRWCAGSLPRNRTPSFPRYCGRPWCSTSSGETDGRGDRPLSRQQSLIGRVAAARRVVDELTHWRCRVPAGHALPAVAHPGLTGGVAASPGYDQPPESTQTEPSCSPRRLALAPCASELPTLSPPGALRGCAVG
jgi:hypothetical protein